VISTFPPLTKYPKGYLPDLKENWTQKSGMQLMRALKPFAQSAPRTPKSYSLEAFEAPIMDQGGGPRGTNSCAGHGTSQGLVVSFAAAGDPLGFIPSQLDIYRLARVKGLKGPHDLLTDTGAYPVFLMSGITEFGIRPMGAFTDGRFSDINVENVNVKPALSDLEEDALTIVTGEYRIDPSDPSAIAQICMCLSQGISVGIGFQVDTVFENWDPSQSPIATYDPTAYQGGHWVPLTSYDGFDTNAPEKTAFAGPNSWSRSWGRNGHFEVMGSWLKKTVIDIYPFVARRVPVIAGAA